MVEPIITTRETSDTASMLGWMLSCSFNLNILSPILRGNELKVLESMGSMLNLSLYGLRSDQKKISYLPFVMLLYVHSLLIIIEKSQFRTFCVDHCIVHTKI